MEERLQGEMEKEEKCVVQENSTEEQSTGEKSVLKGKLRYYSGEIQRDVTNLVKWLILAVVVGCVVGAASTLFSFVLKGVTSYRKANGWMFYLLPVMGLIIVFLYEKFGKEMMAVRIRFFLRFVQRMIYCFYLHR